MPIVEFTTKEGPRLLVNARPDGTSLLVGDELALNYDGEGRLIGAWVEGRNYIRSLDNHILEKQEGPLPGLSYRVRRELSESQVREFVERVRGWVAGFRETVRHASGANGGIPAQDRETVEQALERILACDLDRLERERELFQRIYKPINILPPDQYLALVLQATEGCSFGRCTFCGFYRDRTFRIKGLEEFKQHVREVRSLFGEGIRLRKTIFLADANALVIQSSQLLPLLDWINAEFLLEPAGLDRDALRAWRGKHPNALSGIYSFVDAFTTRRLGAPDFAELAVRGLRRVYIGLESGDPELLHFMGKPNSPEDVLHLVQELKAGGIAVGLVILVGAGGEKFAQEHVHQTVELINRLPLDSHDLVYFSELVDYAGSTYSTLAREGGIRPLSIPEIEAQVAQMRAGFRFSAPDGPKLSYYDVREFIY